MVQVLPRNSKTFGEQVAGGIERGGERAAQLKQMAEQSRMQMENQLALQSLKGQQRQTELAQKEEAERAQLEQTYPIIEKRFGKNAADLFKSLGTGAQTDLIHTLLQGESRNQGLENQLGEPEAETPEEFMGESTRPQKEKGKITDFDRGLTPAERVKRQEARYKTNLPLFMESAGRLQAAQNEQDDLAILEDLSPRISGLQRLNVNPRTGDLLLPAAASDDAQRYVKTINNFTRNAKETYGSRITNFDLQQFLKRLPTLANSEEGRRQIIEQMKIINGINIAHDTALQEVIGEHGGIRNIDYDRARANAEARTKDQIKSLRSQFKDIGSSVDKTYQTQIKEFKAITPKDHVAVERADGSTGYIPKDRVKSFLEVEGNRVL
jgi:hypothetical protein